MGEVEYKEECGNCRYWLEYSEAIKDGKRESFGHCRKQPPAYYELMESRFPMTIKRDWCGSWFKGVGRG